jgi:hypothetical protein
LGIFTKAFFIPIAAGMGFFLLNQMFRDKKNRLSFKNYFVFLPIFLPPLLAVISWSIYQYLSLGHLVTSADVAALNQHGGFLYNWGLHSSLKKVFFGLGGFLLTYIWAGSWSLVKLNLFFYIPLVFLFIWIVISSLICLRKIPTINLLWLPCFILFFLAIGFIIHIFICIAAYGTPNTPGWYLHILMPWTAPLLGLGIKQIFSSLKQKFIFFIGMGYNFLFHLIAIWSQLTLYTGCAEKAGKKYYVFPNHYFCLDHLPGVMQNLAVYGYPQLAFIGFLVGFSLIWISIYLFEGRSYK